MQFILKIDPVSYRQHSLEQADTPEELTDKLQQDLIIAILRARSGLIRLASGILNGDDVDVTTDVRDSYIDLPEGEVAPG